jgi:CdiI N-terminal domain
MFEIALCSERLSRDGFTFYQGRLVLGSTVERLECASHLWSPSQYRQQWKEVARYLVRSRNGVSAFVQSMGKGPNSVILWSVCRKGSWFKFRQQYVFLVSSHSKFDAMAANGSRYVRRSWAARSGVRPSEWRVLVKDVRKWLRRSIEN